MRVLGILVLLGLLLPPVKTAPPIDYKLVYALMTADGIETLYQVDMETFESSLYAECPSPECTDYWGQAFGNQWDAHTTTSIRREDGGQIELVLRSDGAEWLLTDTPGDDYMGDWSPDGRWVVFTSVDESAGWNGDIYLVRTDGTEQQPLTATEDYTEENPVWSPDGEWIAFERRWLQQGGGYIYRMRPDGSDLQQVSPENGSGAAWSPDSQWIVYSSYRSGAELYIAAADGSSEDRLTRTPGYDEEPSWSPDGEWIVFESALDGNLDLYLVRKDGSETIQLTSSPDYEIDPIWIITSDTE